MAGRGVALCRLAGVEAGHPDGPLAVSRPLAWCSTRLAACPPPQGTAGGIPSHGERLFDPRDATGLFLREPSNEALQLKRHVFLVCCVGESQTHRPTCKNTEGFMTGVVRNGWTLHCGF